MSLNMFTKTTKTQSLNVAMYICCISQYLLNTILDRTVRNSHKMFRDKKLSVYELAQRNKYFNDIILKMIKL